ncbi:hypothetical protein SAMN05444166_5737 [Singulisphaera sp. GP187]|uniref:hypothetical protein n=1 Tax=Singulisphaera sp. GP187 TaxID=1882752 RepID=UPI0009293A1B|nr:hypothetical protein [Singulisphaera sp. GP187]SIO58592.1 hypothetical protein SAMN05444166_5737 [Singulisphaera sp. GP187]
MRVPRFSLRGLMVLIALLAVSLSAWVTLNRSIGRGGRLYARARSLAAMGRSAREYAAEFQACNNPKPPLCRCCHLEYLPGRVEANATKRRVTVHTQYIRQFESIAARLDSMSLQCLHAADRPWVAAPTQSAEWHLASEAISLFGDFRSNAQPF